MTKSFSFTRRAVLSAAAVAATTAAGMPQIMVRAAHAQVPMPEIDNPGFNRFRLGSFEITTIYDGGRAGDGPHPTFGADQDSATVATLLEENLLPTDRFVNGFTPTLVNTGSELVLFDTGFGPAGRENGLGRLRERMQASGYRPEDVSIVIVTHFHPDHISGLMEGDSPAFPNARYVVGQTEYDFWTAPERMSGPTERVATLVERNIKPLAEKMTMVREGNAVTGGITGMMASGHTPGHMIFLIESEGRQLVVTADTCNHFVVSLQRPDWHVAFDMDKEAAAATRRRVFDMIAADRLPFIGYHMPFPAVGYVEKLDIGYRYVPETYQLDI